MSRTRPIVPSANAEGNGQKDNEHEDNGQEDASFDPATFEQDEPAAQTEAPDPFDPDALRLDSTDCTATGVKKIVLSIPVRKPGKAEFVRAHPDLGYRIQTGTIELKEEREIYLVSRPLCVELAGEANFRPKLFVTSITRQGVFFLWPLNLPRPDGRTDEWTRSALDAVQMAQTAWVRVTANMGLGAYDLAQATGKLDDPIWPEMTFKEILRLAFRERYIDKTDHPVLRRLRGEV